MLDIDKLNEFTNNHGELRRGHMAQMGRVKGPAVNTQLHLFLAPFVLTALFIPHQNNFILLARFVTGAV